MIMSRFLPSFATVLGLSFVASPALADLIPLPGDDAVVNLPQTPVKWQSIGNCWAYATMGWAESMILAGTGITEDFSETYHTYRHFEEQLLSRRAMSELSTGGNWYPSMNLLLRYGMMREADFIPAEANLTRSDTQKRALDYLNASLRSGRLSQDRSPQTVRLELDRAFGVNMAALSSRVISPSRVSLGRDASGRALTLESQIRNWRQVEWDDGYRFAPRNPSALPALPTSMSTANQNLLRRVKRALNDGHPVVMNWFVDFNALDNRGIFSLGSLQRRGAGSQGYHQTVIEDYVVSGIHPVTGQRFFIGEGEASPEEKKLAEEHGNIEYFVVKNSWGGSERLDRSSYYRDGTHGYHRLDANYLFAWMPFNDEKTGQYRFTVTGLSGFILPAGY